MTDHEDRRSRRLSEVHESRGAFAHLANVSRSPFQIPSEDSLDRVHDHHGGSARGRGSKNRLETCLTQERDIVRWHVQTIGSQFHLQGRLLARNVQRIVPGQLQRRRHLQ